MAAVVSNGMSFGETSSHGAAMIVSFVQKGTSRLLEGRVRRSVVANTLRRLLRDREQKGKIRGVQRVFYSEVNDRHAEGHFHYRGLSTPPLINCLPTRHLPKGDEIEDEPERGSLGPRETREACRGAPESQSVFVAT